MKKLKILLVEDDTLISEMTKELLIECADHSIFQAYSFSEALICLAKEKFDLIFLDINLNGNKDGVELAQIIKKKFGTPFVFITSYGDRLTIERATNENPEAYLTKPISFPKVYSTLSIIANKIEDLERIKFKDSGEDKKLLVDDLMFLKTDNIYLELHTAERKIVIRSTLENFIEENPFESLIRVHRSYLINKKHVSHSTGQSVIIDNHEIPVSRKYKANLEHLTSL